MDPHGAVGYLGLQAFFKENQDLDATGIFLETAHPAKFIDVVESTLDMEIPIPPALQVLADKPKIADAMTTDFDDFKAFLMNEYA
jgi:threonine synthase